MQKWEEELREAERKGKIRDDEEDEDAGELLSFLVSRSLRKKAFLFTTVCKTCLLTSRPFALFLQQDQSFGWRIPWINVCQVKPAQSGVQRRGAEERQHRTKRLGA